MKKLHFFFLTFFIGSLSAEAQSPSVIREYVDKFKDIAMLEMIRTGVPASITLAQGIHETGAGRSVLVIKSNNHFGIKCKSEWKGESVSHDDDARGECFRKYESPLDSYRDHSDFLRNRSHYASLFNLDPTDYEGWAYGLKKAGYATNPKYPQILIKLIRDYNLQDYTLIALGKKQPENGVVFANTTVENKEPAVEPVADVPAKEYNYPSGVFKINETKVIFIPKGTSYLAIANEHRISLPRLFEFNDMMPEEAATRSHLLYLQRKRKTGDNEFHVVEAGQTLHDIAQQQGIRLESLLHYNLLKEHMQPAVGEKLYLRSEASVMPRLASDKPATTVLKEQASQPAYAAYITHAVQPKETMYALTKKYNVSADDIMKWNELETTDLKTGQVLRIYKKD